MSGGARKQRPVWIDTDAGFDDIVAIEIAAATPGNDLLGISLVAGNAPLACVTDNALRAAAFFGWRAPVHAGAAKPLAAELVTAENILGKGGLATIGASFPPVASACKSDDAVSAMAAALRQAAAPVTLVALGPLTNIALLLARGDIHREAIAGLALMGGSAGRGNHSAAAEFNFACDPEAAEMVFASGLPIHMFGLDAGRICTVSKLESDSIRQAGTQRAEIIADHFDAYLRIASPDASLPMPFYDPTVTAWLADESLIGFDGARVEIETAGRHTRGMSVCEFRVPKRAQPNALVAMRADAPGVRKLICERLIDAARRQSA